MKLLKNDQIQVNLWNQFVSDCQFASPFQTPKFYEFFNSIDGLSADVFAVEEKGKLKSLIVVTIQKEKGLKSTFSKRGIVYGGPLILNNTFDNIGPLLEGINLHYKKKLIFIEIRNYFDYSAYSESFIKSSFEFNPWLNFQLPIDEIEIVKKNMSSSRLRQIKKAIKGGVNWKVADNEVDIVSFYDILNDLYKNKIRKPLFPIEFFINYFKMDIGKFLLIYYENKVIGGIICPLFGNETIFEFYVCGLDSEYKEQYPSVMATWAAIEYGNQCGIKLFDFMGAGSPEEDYGVREFKSRFGGVEVKHGRYINILNPLLYKTGVLGLKVLSKLSK